MERSLVQSGVEWSGEDYRFLRGVRGRSPLRYCVTCTSWTASFRGVGMEWKGKERKGKERKGKERKGKNAVRRVDGYVLLVHAVVGCWG